MGPKVVRTKTGAKTWGGQTFVSMHSDMKRIWRNPAQLITSFWKKLWFCGCEGDLVATSVIPLITRVDSADLAGVPFLPHRSMCVPPEAARPVEEDDHPR